MAAILYYLTIPVIYLLSVLPFPLLYLLSDVVFYLLYYVLGYRKKVVTRNLRNAFPEKTEKEVLAIRRAFYRYFCDLFLETFKTLSISEKTMLRHCWLDEESKQLFNDLGADHRSIMIVMGHQGNWEWAGNTFSLFGSHQLYVIYHPLSNKYFNGLVYRMRTRFGTKLIAMKDTLRDMIKNRQELTATAFIADQSPRPDHAHWMSFMNQDTPVFLGIERIAQKIRYPVVYVSIKRVKRGYYSLHAERIELPSPEVNRLGELTELHTRKLEEDIRKQPETWLWTHKRWKHSRTKA